MFVMLQHASNMQDEMSRHFEQKEIAQRRVERLMVALTFKKKRVQLVENSETQPATEQTDSNIIGRRTQNI